MTYKILQYNDSPFVNAWVIRRKEFETLEEAKKEVEAMIRQGVPVTNIKIFQEIPFDIAVK